MRTGEPVNQKSFRRPLRRGLSVCCDGRVDGGGRSNAGERLRATDRQPQGAGELPGVIRSRTERRAVPFPVPAFPRAPIHPRAVGNSHLSRKRCPKRIHPASEASLDCSAFIVPARARERGCSVLPQPLQPALGLALVLPLGDDAMRFLQLRQCVSSISGSAAFNAVNAPGKLARRHLEQGRRNGFRLAATGDERHGGEDRQKMRCSHVISLADFVSKCKVNRERATRAE